MSNHSDGKSTATAAVTVGPGAQLRPARLRLSGVVVLMLLCFSASDLAARPGVQQAIEQLEGCRGEANCVRILKRRPGADPDKEQIKAEIRGARIIWYEYDRRSGAIRRLN